MSDRVFAAAWLAVCTLIVVQMLALEVPIAYEPVGPRVFPVILSALMAVCCLVLIARPDPDVHWPSVPVLIRGGLLVAILLAYAQLFERLGFPLATGLMALLVNLLFGGRWWSGLITAVVVGVGGYLAFDLLLGVSLPSSGFGRLL